MSSMIINRVSWWLAVPPILALQDATGIVAYARPLSTLPIISSRSRSVASIAGRSGR